MQPGSSRRVPTPQLTPPQRTRLIRLLGMLGSAHAGERANAAAFIEKFRREVGFEWDTLVEPATAQPPPVRDDDDADPDPFASWPDGWRRAIQMCLRAERLREWDRKFLGTIAAYKHRPSLRQLDILRRIAERVLGGEGAS